MMRGVVAEAPGKVVISGEYAVLAGAPALSMAVNCRASVRFLPGSGPEGRLSMPGFSEQMLSFKADDGALEWSSGQSSSLFAAAWSELQPKIPAATDVVLDTARFRQVRSGRKLGLGSSAALAVALTAVLQRFAPPAASLASLAHQVHQSFQEGQGSGVDVATSLTGGLIEYSREERAVRQLHWPEGLHYQLFYSGRAADTRRKLAQLARQAPLAEFDALQAAAVRVAGDFKQASATELFDRFRDYVQSLQAFDQASDLGIYAAGHAAVAKAALRKGLIYKPCGAGGGDIGIALTLDPAELSRFAATAATLGFESLDVVLDTDGCQVREIADE